jgi:hypothetical protein
MMNTTPEHWCRAFFKLGSYCDSVENNLCESFNNAIMRARFFPIITSMEIIRKKVMVRIQENRAKSNSWPGTICPNIFKKLKMNITRSAKCQILWNGQDGFEVEENQYRRFTVNLEKMSCSCRYWELSGLPCSHAISAIYTVGKELEDFIAPCYRIDVYNQIYDHVLQPLEGKENWPEATNPRPFPPIRKKMPGRPKTERRREEGEKPKGTKLSKKGTKITCSLCGGLGHNKRKCAVNPDGGAKEHASFTKAAKHSKKKQMKQTGQVILCFFTVHLHFILTEFAFDSAFIFIYRVLQMHLLVLLKCKLQFKQALNQLQNIKLHLNLLLDLIFMLPIMYQAPSQ